MYCYLYLILDLYSRKIVAWEVWEEESAENASILVKRGALSEQCQASRSPLVLHSDNGSPMKGASIRDAVPARDNSIKKPPEG
ncbi:DDE-type integrase/transposase/recombinase [Paenibacillus allorhizoplanae]|uniref:DDE-type integrase/transposase/recombinase n=1 Tax=Paenibacillus allorhizoplanae TaxID=2905648 RepID=UPI003B84678F